MPFECFGAATEPAVVAEPVRAVSRAIVAASRVKAARVALGRCELCEHRCGVNRLAGEVGLCRAGIHPRVHMVQVEVADELELIPTFAVALSGCDMRCSFCITGAQSWNPKAGVELTPQEVAGRAEVALADGARTIMILGGEPTIHLPYVLEIVAALPDSAKLVWKTNAFGAETSRALLYGLFDVWCADYKFGNDACAERLSQTPDYIAAVQRNLLWAAGQSDLIVRHLLMPGHVDCCWSPVAAWLGREMPGVKVNLRSGFWPAWQAHRHAELRGSTTRREVDRAQDIAAEWHLNLIG